MGRSVESTDEKHTTAMLMRTRGCGAPQGDTRARKHRRTPGAAPARAGPEIDISRRFAQMLQMA
jgi:hypothetical protein